MGVHPEQGAHAVGVGLVDLPPVAAADLVVDAGLLHLEAGGVDQQVERIGLALEHRPLRRDLGDALALGVDQMDVGRL